MSLIPRSGWKQQVEELGLLFHTTEDGSPEGKPYWNEEACYRFSSNEIDVLEKATNDLHARCLEAVQFVIDNDRFAQLKIPPQAIPAIKWAWEAEPPSIYGRFDLAYDGRSAPKLLEYNADTPTSLLEAAVIQWHWLEDRYPKSDQFNSIWEGFVEYWKWCIENRYLKGDLVHFAHTQSIEDMMTATTIRDTAQEAGLQTVALHMSDIGWDDTDKCFVDLQNRPIKTIFKLYPWEWLLADEFGNHALETYEQVQWIEPIWKMILSNKGILAILWEMFPNHPNLLPAYFDRSYDLKEYVKKPLLSREGANVTVKQGGTLMRTGGEYGEEGYIFQQYVELPNFLGSRPVLGTWVLDAEARGMGVREADSLVTDNFSRFVPHYFE